jgi:hypothetical protein
VAALTAAAAAELRGWPARRWALAGAAAAVCALVTGVPTDLIDTPLFGRTVAVTAWASPVWIAASLLAGMLLAAGRGGRPLAGGGALAVLAVACPVCIKPVVLLAGTGGALAVFAPLQPALGALAVVALASAVVVRLGRAPQCDVPPASSAPEPGGTTSSEGAGRSDPPR